MTGSGYVEYKLREGRHPTRADLDAAVPGRPAILFHTSLHACVLNTPALREAGLDDRQPDPPGGRFGRDRDGRLDGLVYEGPTFTLLWGGLRRDMERMNATLRAGLVARAARHFAARGASQLCAALAGDPLRHGGVFVLWYHGWSSSTQRIRSERARADNPSPTG